MKLARKIIFYLLDLLRRLHRHGPSPNIGYFPDVQLAVGYDIAPRTSQVTAHPCTDSIDRLPYVNRNSIQITKSIDSDRVREFLKLCGAVSLEIHYFVSGSPIF